MQKVIFRVKKVATLGNVAEVLQDVFFYDNELLEIKEVYVSKDETVVVGVTLQNSAEIRTMKSYGYAVTNSAIMKTIIDNITSINSGFNALMNPEKERKVYTKKEEVTILKEVRDESLIDFSLYHDEEENKEVQIRVKRDEMLCIKVPRNILKTSKETFFYLRDTLIRKLNISVENFRRHIFVPRILVFKNEYVFLVQVNKEVKGKLIFSTVEKINSLDFSSLSKNNGFQREFKDSLYYAQIPAYFKNRFNYFDLPDFAFDAETTVGEKMALLTKYDNGGLEEVKKQSNEIIKEKEIKEIVEEVKQTTTEEAIGLDGITYVKDLPEAKVVLEKLELMHKVTNTEYELLFLYDFDVMNLDFEAHLKDITISIDIVKFILANKLYTFQKKKEGEEV